MGFLKLKYFVVSLLLLSVYLSSCAWQKRLYRKGFYVSNKSSPGKFQHVNPGHRSETAVVSNLPLIEKEQVEKISGQKKTTEKTLPQPLIFPKRKNNLREIPGSRSQRQNATRKKERSEKLNVPRPRPEEIDFAEEKKVNTLFLVAFICGIAGFIIYIPAIAAVICAAIGRAKEKQFPYKVKRHTLGTLGLIFGIIMLGILLLYLGLFLLAGGI